MGLNETESAGLLHLPARDIPIPAHLSVAARAYLKPLSVSTVYPPMTDKAAWRAYIAASEAQILPLLRHISAEHEAGAKVQERTAGSVGIFDITPPTVSPDSQGVILELHGGGLITCTGELCRLMGVGLAARLQQRVWAVDYRTPTIPIPPLWMIAWKPIALSCASGLRARSSSAAGRLAAIWRRLWCCALATRGCHCQQV